MKYFIQYPNGERKYVKKMPSGGIYTTPAMTLEELDRRQNTWHGSEYSWYDSCSWIIVVVLVGLLITAGFAFLLLCFAG